MNRNWMTGMAEVPFPTREALASSEPFRVLVPYWWSLARRRHRPSPPDRGQDGCPPIPGGKPGGANPSSQNNTGTRL